MVRSIVGLLGQPDDAPDGEGPRQRRSIAAVPRREVLIPAQLMIVPDARVGATAGPPSETSGRGGANRVDLH
jgi:hypothetical protein